MVTTWRYNRVEMDTRGLVTSAYSNLITKMIIITAMAKIYMLSTINQIWKKYLIHKKTNS
jgi:hypothetical protein